MDAMRVKRDKEELKKKEEEVARISTSLGSYYETVREIEGVLKRVKEGQEVYDEEHTIFELHRNRLEGELERKSEVLKGIYARHEQINEEMTGVTKKRIQVVGDFHTLLNEIHRKMGHLTEYANKLKTEVVECKEEIEKKRSGYEKDCLIFRKRLEIEKDDL